MKRRCSQPARGRTNAHCCHNWNHMLSNGAEVQLCWECVDSWEWKCIFSFMSARLRAPLLCFLSGTQTDQTCRINGAGHWQSSSVPAAVAVEELDLDLLTSPPRVRFQLPWLVAKDYFILTHVKSELTYGAKPQPAEPSVSECKLISLAVCYCLENPAT